jgi:tetratricopeptide (TPR) repeat protein
LYNLNKYDEAIKAYDKAIEIDLRNSLAWYNKGDSLGRLNKSDEAKKAYDKANGINPNSPYAWNGNGRDFDNLICLELLRIF